MKHFALFISYTATLAFTAHVLQQPHESAAIFCKYEIPRLANNLIAALPFANIAGFQHIDADAPKNLDLERVKELKAQGCTLGEVCYYLDAITDTECELVEEEYNKH